MTDRRDFLIACGTAATTGLGGSAVLAAVPDASFAGGGESRNRFARHMDGTFRVTSVQDLRETSARLTEVRGIDCEPRVEQFVLEFEGVPGSALSEGTYAVTTPDGERYALFLQPASGAGADRRFRSSFSLLN
jgi:hypothetical protein